MYILKPGSLRHFNFQCTFLIFHLLQTVCLSRNGIEFFNRHTVFEICNQTLSQSKLGRKFPFHWSTEQVTLFVFVFVFVFVFEKEIGRKGGQARLRSDSDERQGNCRQARVPAGWTPKWLLTHHIYQPAILTAIVHNSHVCLHALLASGFPPSFRKGAKNCLKFRSFLFHRPSAISLVSPPQHLDHQKNLFSQIWDKFVSKPL